MQAGLSAGHCEPARKRRHRRQINSTNDTGSAFILCLMLRVLFDREGKRCMTFASARLLLVIAGVVLPYAARLPFGLEWVRQYTRKLPRQAGTLKVELSAYLLRYSTGVIPPSESWDLAWL
ncbi:hypothetical protein F7R02_17120 [Xanthomonas cissicola]|nr:hypothetical protein F7R02_17120 [Xanthomonas cissicola]